MRPDFVTDKHLEFLDHLRESGVTNMYGSPSYVEREFDVDTDTARNIVTYWMQSFGEDNR